MNLQPLEHIAKYSLQQVFVVLHSCPVVGASLHVRCPLSQGSVSLVAASASAAPLSAELIVQDVSIAQVLLNCFFCIEHSVPNMLNKCVFCSMFVDF